MATVSVLESKALGASEKHQECRAFPELRRVLLVAQMVKNLPEVQETLVQSGSGRSPEKGMTTHSSVLAWRIPQTEEPGGLQSMGLQSQTEMSN